jgi:hypothetical protein
MACATGHLSTFDGDGPVGGLSYPGHVSSGDQIAWRCPAGPREGAFMADPDVVVVGGGIAGSALAGC